MSTGEEIDAHVHLWVKERNEDVLFLKNHPEYADRSGPKEVAEFRRQQGVGRMILVQSAPSSVHSKWLSQTAREIEGVCGVVGWIDPTSPTAGRDAATLVEDAMICGIRLMLNRMDDPEPIFTSGPLLVLEQLAAAGLGIEILCPMSRLSLVDRLARAHPEFRLVVDHCGFPPVNQTSWQQWASDMENLAVLPSVAVKFSGLFGLNGPTMPAEIIAASAKHVMALFGPRRLMAASNFPCSDTTMGARAWREMSADFVEGAGWSDEDRLWLSSLTAQSWFRCLPNGQAIGGNRYGND